MFHVSQKTDWQNWKGKADIFQVSPLVNNSFYFALAMHSTLIFWWSYFKAFLLFLTFFMQSAFVQHWKEKNQSTYLSVYCV